MTTHFPNGKQEHSAPYTWRKGTVSVAGVNADTDLTTITGFETIFDAFPDGTAHRIRIYVSATYYVRLNSLTNDIITITSTTPYIQEMDNVKKIYVSGGTGDFTVVMK